MTAYIPREGSLAAKVCDYFKRNPDQVLSAADIALKWDAANIAKNLESAVLHDLLAIEAIKGGRVYRAGHALNSAPIPDVRKGGFSSWCDEKGSPSAEGLPKPEALPAPESIEFEEGIEMPPAGPAAVRFKYEARFAQMGVDQSCKLTPASAKVLIGYARSCGKRLNRKFVMRQIDDKTARIWRTV